MCKSERKEQLVSGLSSWMYSLEETATRESESSNVQACLEAYDLLELLDTRLDKCPVLPRTCLSHTTSLDPRRKIPCMSMR